MMGDDQGPVRTRFSERRDGNFAVDSELGALTARRRALIGLPWSWLDQVHGTRVVDVKEPGGASGETGDALVTNVAGAVLAVQTADCAPLLLWSSASQGPVVAAVHAGWRGLYDGIVESTVARLRQLGAGRVQWRLGPCISPQAYEFGAGDLATLALRFGPEVVGVTADGTAAFDLPSAVWSVLRSLGIEPARADRPPCTATSVDDQGRPRWFSHRARADTERQTSAIWIQP
jgi:YfiH family protein